MPTGYTAILGERDDVTFREFCLRCARAMGACIMQRDDPLDQLPLVDEVPSDYHEKALSTAREQLALYENMTLEQAQIEQLRILNKRRGEQNEVNSDRKVLGDRYRGMLAQVKAWEPPTSNHQGFKNFMLDQLRESIKFDCGSAGDSHEEEPISPAKWLQSEQSKAQNNCDYHIKHEREERERIAGRNRWKRDLIASLEEE